PLLLRLLVCPYTSLFRSGIVLSIKFKVPVITAWSAPGTALLVALFPGITLNEMVAAYISSAIIIFIIGVTGSFDRLLKAIPQGRSEEHTSELQSRENLVC